MKNLKEIYSEKLMTADEALELIKDGDYMFSAQAAGEPAEILSHLGHLKCTGVKNTTLNTCLPLQYYEAFKDPEMQGVMSHNGWFFSAMPIRENWSVQCHKAPPQFCARR